VAFVDVLRNSSTCGQQQFNPALSRTFAVNGTLFNISYGDGGGASGVLGSDTLWLGGVRVPRQTFGLACDQWRRHDLLDGIVGMGFVAISVTSTPPLWQTAWSQMEALGAEPLFTVFISSAENGTGSELIFGGTDDEHAAAPLIYTPVTDARVWFLSLDYIAIGSTNVSTNVSAFVDTGSSYNHGPRVDVERVAASLGARFFNYPLAQLPIAFPSQ
jgi:hypothetical protein